MWKNSVYAFIIGTALLVGCNTNDRNNAADENLGNDINRGVNDVQEDVNNGVNDVERGVDDTLDNNGNDNNMNNGNGNGNGTMNNNGTNNNLDANDGVSNSNGAGQNGVTAPNGDERILNDNQEDIIEDQVDINDRDRKDE